MRVRSWSWRRSFRDWSRSWAKWRNWFMRIQQFRSRLIWLSFVILIETKLLRVLVERERMNTCGLNCWVSEINIESSLEFNLFAQASLASTFVCIVSFLLHHVFVFWINDCRFSTKSNVYAILELLKLGYIGMLFDYTLTDMVVEILGALKKCICHFLEWSVHYSNYELWCTRNVWPQWICLCHV